MGLTVGAPLFAVALAVLALGLRFITFRGADRARARLADDRLVARYVRLPAGPVSAVRLGLLGLGVLALALASRAGGTEARRIDPEGAETILLLDASNSMLAEDVEPSRLALERRLAGRLARIVAGRIGVVYFAGRAYVLSPLTTDLNAIQMFVEGVRPAAVGLGGSSLATGLTQALDLLAGGEETARKSIVLFTDGEETVGQPVRDALDRAREAGVVVHAVGLGTEEGGQIPLSRDASLDPTTALRRRSGGSVLQGPDGRPVITRLEEATLREIVAATGGTYVRGSRGTVGLERIIADAGSSLPAGGNAGVGILLFLAFASLWGEGFLFPRG